MPGVAQIELRDLLEAARGVEARGQFVGKRLVVDKAIGAGRADGLFVQVHGITLAAVEAGHLRPEQCTSVLEVFWAMLRPHPEQPIVCSQRFDVLLPFAGGGKVEQCCMGKPGIKMIFSRFEL